MGTKEVKVSDLYEALKSNGFEHIRGMWTAEDVEGFIIGGCALQQAAMNISSQARGAYSVRSQLNKLGKIPKDSKWYKQNYSNKIGDTIIEWNDAEIYDVKERRYSPKLRTYKAVTKMAYDILEPHMHKTITLREKKWKIKRKKDGTPFVLETING